MIKINKVLSLKDLLLSKSKFSYNQLIATALLGSSFGTMSIYDVTKVYNHGDKIVYISPSGEFLIIACIEDNVTGAFDPSKWEEFNIMDEMDRLYEDLIVLSWNEPHLRRNKVWVEVKADSIGTVENEFGAMPGIIIYNNLVISARQPKLNPSIIWGQITGLV